MYPLKNLARRDNEVGNHASSKLILKLVFSDISRHDVNGSLCNWKIKKHDMIVRPGTTATWVLW